MKHNDHTIKSVSKCYNDIVEECRRKKFDDAPKWLLEDCTSKMAKGGGAKKRFQKGVRRRGVRRREEVPAERGFWQRGHQSLPKAPEVPEKVTRGPKKARGAPYARQN